MRRPCRVLRLLLATALLGQAMAGKRLLTVCGWTGCKFYQKAKGVATALSALYPADYEARLDESPDRDTYRGKLDALRQKTPTDAKAQSHTSSPLVFLTEGGAPSLFRTGSVRSLLSRPVLSGGVFVMELICRLMVMMLALLLCCARSVVGIATAIAPATHVTFRPHHCRRCARVVPPLSCAADGADDSEAPALNEEDGSSAPPPPEDDEAVLLREIRRRPRDGRGRAHGPQLGVSGHGSPSPAEHPPPRHRLA